ncbi:MAG: hypothetical protein WB784_06470 [Rhodanobacteraceae bacterium]
METVASKAQPCVDGSAPGTVEQAGDAIQAGLRVVESTLDLLRAELRLARSSAVALVWLTFALIFLGVGTWLAASAALAAGIYQFTGNLFAGIGSVALANLIGAVAVLWAMRRCWGEMTLPRTRRLFTDKHAVRS